MQTHGWEGNPDYVRMLGEQAALSDVADRVTILGFQADPFAAMREADIGLMCSRQEALGRVTIEMMKLGKPVVGTASGGDAEPRQAGLHRPADKPVIRGPRLPGRIPGCDRGILRRIGERAAEWAHSNFNAERYAADLERVLTQAIDEGTLENRLAPVRAPRVMCSAMVVLNSGASHLSGARSRSSSLAAASMDARMGAWLSVSRAFARRRVRSGTSRPRVCYPTTAIAAPASDVAGPAPSPLPAPPRAGRRYSDSSSDDREAREWVWRSRRIPAASARSEKS